MSDHRRAKLRLVFAMTMFGTLGLFIRAIPLPSSVIALVRGAVGAGFLLLLCAMRKTPPLKKQRSSAFPPSTAMRCPLF